VKLAIIFSCFITAAMIGMYSVVMGQIKNLENFYGNMDKYTTNAMTSQNSTENPYIPNPIKDVSQPLKNTSFQQ
jgi:hypothetical protein